MTTTPKPFVAVSYEETERAAIIKGLAIAARQAGFDARDDDNEDEALEIATKLENYVPRDLSVAHSWILGLFLKGMAEGAMANHTPSVSLLHPAETV